MIDDDVFGVAHNFVAKWEGGFSDHKSDPGGATQYGVSLRWLKSLGVAEGDFDKDGDVDIDDILLVTKSISRDLFKRHFWDKPRYWCLDPKIACVCYDTAVNCGVSRANKLLQQAVGVDQDGIIGAKTLVAIATRDSFDVALDMITYRERFYRDLALKSQRYAPFLRGWLNRTTDLRRLIVRYWGK